MRLWRFETGCSRAEAEAAVAAADLPDGIAALMAEERNGAWFLVGWTEGPPDEALLRRFAALAPRAGCVAEARPEADADWVALSQQGLPPVDAGRFHVHDRAHSGHARPGQIAIRVEAGPAFGTGHHDTTRGCLLTLDRLARHWRPRRILDVGTGTGLLAIAALLCWRGAAVEAGDIDPRSVTVAQATARANGLAPGRFRPLLAAGVFHRRLLASGPYDLVMANILAGPLVGLAPLLAPAVRPGGRLVLAGLLAAQRPAVLAAYHARGFRTLSRGRGDWLVLVLGKRGPRPRLRPGPGPLFRAARRGTAGRRRLPDEA
jgi:ribosomal protein L11 methyltransferase